MSRSASILRLAGRALALGCCCALLVLAGAASAQAPSKKDEKEKKSQSTGLSKRVAEKLTDANTFIEASNYDAALGVVEELSKRRGLSPSEIAQVHRFRGYILVSKEKNEEAIAAFEKSLEAQGLDPSSENQMIYTMATLYTQMGKYDKALALINTWFEGEENPKPDAYHLKAMILVQQEKFKQALEPAKTAVEISEKPRESWVQLLVAIYSQLQDYPNVAATLERLVAMSPGKKHYWVQLAAVQNYLEREAKALAALRIAYQGKLLTEDRELRQLSRLLFLRDLPFQCAETLQEGLGAGIVKADADSYRLMSNCFIAARENDRALEPLAKAGELATDGDMYMLLGQMHLQKDRFDPALDALRKALAKSKPEQRGSVQLMIGVAQLGKNDYAGAERSFHAAQGDKKVSKAAESYLKFLAAERARKELHQQMQQVSAEG